MYKIEFLAYYYFIKKFNIMKYHPYFIAVFIINTIFGILFAFFNNNLDDNSKTSEENNDIQKDDLIDKYDKSIKSEKNNHTKKDDLKEKSKASDIDTSVKYDIIDSFYSQNQSFTIPCAYATDNGYIYPTLVSITSLVQNAKDKTFYEIYIMISYDLTEENKKILKSVENKYKKKCKIIFIDMGIKFQGVKITDRVKTPAYYRLELPDLLPNISQIIYMDGDTLIFEDLTELIEINMKDDYVYGFLDERINALRKYGIENGIYLCSGVLLMNLNALRKDNISEKFIEFLNKEKDRIDQNDQTIINVVCQEKIGTLPPKYGIWNFPDKSYAKRHNKLQRKKVQYNSDEFEKAYLHPSIIHYVFKPFGKEKKYLYNEWWDYAKRTGYYNEIYDLYLNK